MTHVERYANGLRDRAERLSVIASEFASKQRYGGALRLEASAERTKLIAGELRKAIQQDQLVDTVVSCFGQSSADERIKYTPDWTKPYTVSEMMNTPFTSASGKAVPGIADRIEAARVDHDRASASWYYKANTLFIGPSDARELIELVRIDWPLFEPPNPKTPDIRKFSGFEWRGLNVFKTNAEGIAVCHVAGRY